MTTSQLRVAMKAVDPAARVSSIGDGVWTVRTKYALPVIRKHARALGLDEIDHDVEGSRHDWTYVLIVREAA
jgi:hypothetical protein